MGWWWWWWGGCHLGQEGGDGAAGVGVTVGVEEGGAGLLSKQGGGQLISECLMLHASPDPGRGGGGVFRYGLVLGGKQLC